MAMKAALDAVLRASVESGDVPGVVAMVTDRQNTLYENAFGMRTLGQSAPMTTDTVGLIASMTKAVTSTAAMQLVEQGKLVLDNPVAKWLPELSSVQVIEGFDAAGQPRLRMPKRPITLRHLLTHTSGFGYEFLSATVQQYQKTRNIPGIFSCELEALHLPLLFDPGERWEYGIGLDWAGRVVEAASGQALGTYLRQNVLDPLGMSDTAFRLTAAMRARLAKIHARMDNGMLAPIDLELPEKPGFELGGGGLYSTLGDYLRFIRMVLNKGDSPGGRILKADTVEMMTRNQIGDLNVPTLKSTDRTLTNDFPLPPDNPQKWGLAWMINTKPLPTGRPAGSLMWAGLTNCYYWIDPTSGIGGAMLTQILPFGDIKALPLFLSFEYQVYANR